MLISHVIYQYSKARMATLVATEEFPYNVTVTPKVSAPAVIKANKLASGVQVVTRTNNSSVSAGLSSIYLYRF